MEVVRSKAKFIKIEKKNLVVSFYLLPLHSENKKNPEPPSWIGVDGSNRLSLDKNTARIRMDKYNPRLHKRQAAQKINYGRNEFRWRNGNCCHQS